MVPFKAHTSLNGWFWLELQKFQINPLGKKNPYFCIIQLCNLIIAQILPCYRTLRMICVLSVKEISTPEENVEKSF